MEDSPRTLKFLGWYSDWPEFKRDFTKTHEDAELMDCHKLEVLHNALPGKVVELVSDVKDYKTAWRMVKRKYDNKANQIIESSKKMTNAIESFPMISFEANRSVVKNLVEDF